MNEVEIAFSPAWQQAEWIARREVSPVELTQLYLGRIERLNPQLGAFITVAADQAVESAKDALARVAESGPSSPLLGVPISLKDLELTRGIRSTLGCPALRDFVPDRDSVVAERVRRSGAVILGKTNTPEIGISFKLVTDNLVGGPTWNPWDPTRTTGSSSGGAAAAMAAGLCAIATGSDGGGSIRIPASFCGVFGFKPSHGRVPRANGFGRSEPNQFAQSGPITRDVRDAALLMNVLAGPDPRDPNPEGRTLPPDFLAALAGDLQGSRIGWTHDFGLGPCDAGVVKVARDAALRFEDAGCIVEEAEVRLPEDLSDHFWNIFAANNYAAYGELLETRGDELGPDGHESLERGKRVSGAEYAGSLRVVNELKLFFGGLMERFDFLMTPTTAITAFDPAHRPTEIGGRPVDSTTGFYPFTFPVNMTGQPAASAPCGFDDGRPVGLHIIGRRGDDVGVLRAARVWEQMHPWLEDRAPIA